MKVGGVCSGIGGLELGLERAGMDIIWHAENDPYCCRVLAKHWPGVPNLGDITTVNWSNVERPDLVCGGFPCQPFSYAGTRQGDTDPRHLWPHVARSVRVLRPRWVLLENVPGLLTLGFGQVAADLAALGYDLEWESLPAAAFGAPHLRYRIFLVAHAECLPGDLRGAELFRRWAPEAEQTRLGCTDVADAASGTRGVAEPSCISTGGAADQSRERGWNARPAGDWWEVEPDVGRVADGIPARVDRLRCLGNAVVPQVAEWVGRQILAADDTHKWNDPDMMLGLPAPGTSGSAAAAARITDKHRYQQP